MVSVVTLVLGFAGLLVVGILAAYGVSIYNQLVSLRKRVDQAKQNVDVLLKQRQDELSKILDAVSEYVDHEEELLVKLTEAREAAEQAESPKEEAQADQQVRNVLGELEARAEAYPDLRSAEQFTELIDRIAEVEEGIADRREVYNEAVTLWNTRIEQLPHVLVANQLGAEPRELFEATEEEKQDVDVGEALA